MDNNKVSKELYTNVDNRLMDALMKAKLNATQIRIMIVIVRYTMGLERDSNKLSTGFIQEATGLNKQHIKDELKNLINKHIILVTEESTYKSPRVLKINLNFDEWIVEWQIELENELKDLAYLQTLVGDSYPKKEIIKKILIS